MPMGKLTGIQDHVAVYIWSEIKAQKMLKNTLLFKRIKVQVHSTYILWNTTHYTHTHVVLMSRLYSNKKKRK